MGLAGVLSVQNGKRPLKIGCLQSKSKTAKDDALAKRWAAWEPLERQWLRRLCLGEKAGELPSKPAAKSPPQDKPQDKR